MLLICYLRTLYVHLLLEKLVTYTVEEKEEEEDYQKRKEQGSIWFYGSQASLVRYLKTG